MSDASRPYEIGDGDAFEELQLNEALRLSVTESEVKAASGSASAVRVAPAGDLFTIHNEAHVGVEVRPTGSRDAIIPGQLSIIQHGETVFLNWVPYTHTDGSHRGGEHNSYTVNFPLHEVHCVTQKGVRLIVGLKSHITLPPFVFESYSIVCDLIRFMTLNLGLVRSVTDEHVYLVGPTADLGASLRVLRASGPAQSKGVDATGGHGVSDFAFRAFEKSAQVTRLLRGLFDPTSETKCAGAVLASHLAKLPQDLADQDEAARRSAEAACAAADDSVQVRSTADLGDLGTFNMLDSMSAAPSRPVCRRKTPVTLVQWKAFFGADDKVTDEVGLRAAVFAGGLARDVRRIAWPFLLGYTYPHMRLPTEALQARAQRYAVVMHQWATMTESQLGRFTALRDMLHTIEKDVPRTDRDMSFYEGDDNVNLGSLQRILNTYGMFNFDLGYVQGMSDICSVLLHVVHDEADTFWCFTGVMERMAKNFAMDQSGMSGHLDELAALIRFLDPELMEYFDRQNADNLYFVFRWLLVFFKREFSFDDIMILWEVLWTNHLSPKFHLFVCCAILDMHRAQMMQTVRELDGLIGYINGLAMKLPVGVVLETAEAIYLQFARSAALPENLRGLVGGPTPARADPVPSDDDLSEKSWIDVIMAQHASAIET